MQPAIEKKREFFKKIKVTKHLKRPFLFLYLNEKSVNIFSIKVGCIVKPLTFALPFKKRVEKQKKVL